MARDGAGAGLERVEFLGASLDPDHGGSGTCRLGAVARGAAAVASRMARGGHCAADHRGVSLAGSARGAAGDERKLRRVQALRCVLSIVAAHRMLVGDAAPQPEAARMVVRL